MGNFQCNYTTLATRCLVAVSIFLATGCGTNPSLVVDKSELDPFLAHAILIHREGYLINTDGKKIDTAARAEGHMELIRNGIDRHVIRIVKSDRDKEPLRLLFFVHGGLNTYADNLDRMKKLIHKDGLLGNSLYYPVFISWESSYWTALVDDLFVVRQGREADNFGRRLWAGITSPFVAAIRFGAGLLRSPISLAHVGDNLGDSLDGQDRTEKALNIMSSVSYWPARLFSLPLIDGFGSPVWEILKRRADFVVTREGGKDGALALTFDLLKCNDSANDLQRRRQSRCLKSDGQSAYWFSGDSAVGRRKVEITLMGHSMGTLVLDKFIREFHDMAFNRIVYLASASSIEDVHVSPFAYLENQKQAYFHAFSLRRGDEAREVQYHCLVGPLCLPSPLEKGSLLDFILGTHPITTKGTTQVEGAERSDEAQLMFSLTLPGFSTGLYSR
jgi:hypothetical protein